MAIRILLFFLLFSSVCNGQAIRAFGDSFTEGNGANSYECYPDKLAQILSYPTQNHSVGAASSSEIRNYLMLDSGHKSYPTILWSGYNNIIDPNQVIADDKAAMSSLGHQRFIVLSVMNNCSRPIGTLAYSNTMIVNNNLKQEFGIRFLDVRDSLVHHKSGDQYWDSVSIADDVPNHYMMWDCVHCNAAGYYFVAQKIAERQAILFGGILSVDSIKQTPRRTRNEKLHYDIYNLNGVLLKTFLSPVLVKPYDILDSYAEGVYIICINGKCVKYMRW